MERVESLSDGAREPFCNELAEFLDGLVSHYVLDNGTLVELSDPSESDT